MKSLWETTKLKKARLRLCCGKKGTIITHNILFCGALLTFLSLSACATAPAPSWTQAGFTETRYQTPLFTLYGAEHLTKARAPVTIYIEGDGTAFITRSQPSTDPTPKSFLVRHWALAGKAANRVYLARPCQFIKRMACTPAVWQEARLSKDVIASLDAALNQIKARAHITTKAPSLHLVGFSGGGAAALLLAAKRSDIASVVTIASPLNQQVFTDWHGLSPMTGSLDPATTLEKTAPIPQTHYIGTDDPVIPLTLWEKIAVGTPLERACTVSVQGATHAGPWPKSPVLKDCKDAN